MRNMMQFYIDGQWVDPVQQRSLDVINPATEKACGRISLGSGEDVDKAVAAARRAAVSFAQTSVKERIELLQNILDIFARRHDEIATVIMEEMGAPWKLARDAQAASGPEHLAVIIEVLKSYRFEEPHGTTHLLKEPIGPCALITPWNWPMNQVAVKVAPALAAVGCGLYHGFETQ